MGRPMNVEVSTLVSFPTSLVCFTIVQTSAFEGRNKDPSVCDLYVLPSPRIGGDLRDLACLVIGKIPKRIRKIQPKIPRSLKFQE